MSTLSMELSPHMDLSDDLLAERIRSHMSTKNRATEKLLSVEVSDRVATLRGQARSYYQRQLWLHDVKSFAELDGIVDLIEVA
ncbi:BON domain-containing protein [Anatilimnocola sp. NA78]|uniref:BON domain-containing protein n=1 Tax=Anatilimnocola sp. NA78 TaxID=3415683 RepID=UPI003CE5AB6C